MYFDEFCTLAKDVTSELFVSIYDCVYNCIPCVKNFLQMRCKFQDMLMRQHRQEGQPLPIYTYQYVQPPITCKTREKFEVQDEEVFKKKVDEMEKTKMVEGQPVKADGHRVEVADVGAKTKGDRQKLAEAEP